MNFFSQNLAKVSPKDGLTNLELETISTKFTEIYELAKSRQQGFWDLPDQNIDSILEFAKKTQGKFTDIVILGIGGSMLGPICLLGGFEKQTVGKNPKVHCLDNIDSDQISLVESQINLEKTLFLVQTKSGTTPETLAQYFYFRSLAEKNNLDIKEHFVFITDPEVGYLRQVAIRENITSFAIPANVGGRFSVLSPVGLVIGALYGLDIIKILTGAKNSLSEKALKSSFDLACIQYLLSQKGKSINVLMPYSSRLRLLANWYTQLLSESIGKEYNLKGQIVNTGITPLPALGATDQHSQLQLFKEGVNDKLLIFINVLNKENSVLIGQNLPDAFDYLNGKTFDDLLQAEFKGTVQSLTESSRPNVTLEIEKLDETSLGEIFMFFQISVAFLGELLEINTFDQPGVERSKVLTREFLEK
jgi:glucose-6-phosphate isomerase